MKLSRRNIRNAVLRAEKRQKTASGDSKYCNKRRLDAKPAPKPRGIDA